MNVRWRKIKCFFGIHEPDTIEDDGRTITQRCLYCDRLIHILERDNANKIRRIK